MNRRERPPDARTEPLHAPGAVTAQVEERVLTGEQRGDRRLRALVEIDGARFAMAEDRRSEPRRAAGRLYYHALRGGIAPAAKPEVPFEQLPEPRGREQGLRVVQHVIGVGQRAQGQRFAQRQHGARLVEQAAHQGRADVTRVKDEMQGPQIGSMSRSIEDAAQRQPSAAGRRAEDAIIEKARGPVGGLAELDYETALAHQVELLRIRVRCGPEAGQQLLGGRASCVLRHQ